jgi:signal transduction histidine kinase/CheY-like chemotaxis protein
MSPQTPTASQLRLFSLLAVIYGGLTLALLPWSHTPGPRLPQVILACNGCIALADLCTAALLGRQFVRDGRSALLLLACAYVFSGVMALLHLSVFPGALLRERLFGNPQTTAWVFIFWRLGTGMLFLAAVLGARLPVRTADARQRLRFLATAVASSLAACALLAALGSTLEVQVVVDTHFTGANITLIALYQAVCALTLLLIWRARGFGDMLYVWLALVLVASMTDQLLGSMSGAQYTIGWHVAKASSAISACLLLVFWLSSMEPSEREGMLNGVAAYVAGLTAVLAALLLRWFLTPWVGAEYPYATLFGAVAIAVWIGGWRPAIVAAALGYLGARIFFIVPVGELRIERVADYIGLVVYIALCAVIIGLGDAMRRARDRLHASDIQLRQRAAELQAADANKSRFLALLSHELRNPLAPLSNGLALLAMGQDEKMLGRTRTMMQRQLVHLRRLIDDLLDVSRIDQGKLQLHRERMSLAGAVRSAVEAARPGIDEKDQTLVVTGASESLHVDGDAVRLSQVVSNLLNNAAKFTPRGGRIELTVTEESGAVLVRVKDDGVGFEPSQAQRIFDMFVQLDETRSQSAGGLGLGLTLVRSIVTMHGGQVEARSEGRGRGAEFCFRLPLIPPPSDAAEAPGPASNNQAQCRVLVVDDNRDAADTLAQILELRGFEVVVCYDGATALAASRIDPPDIAFIDLDMPGMTGYELARRLREEMSDRVVQLVALTGMGRKSDIEGTRQAGFACHLTKPARVEDIIDLVTRAATPARGERSRVSTL